MRAARSPAQDPKSHGRGFDHAIRLFLAEQATADIGQRRDPPLIHLTPAFLGEAPERRVVLEEPVDEFRVIILGDRHQLELRYRLRS